MSGDHRNAAEITARNDLDFGVWDKLLLARRGEDRRRTAATALERTLPAPFGVIGVLGEQTTPVADKIHRLLNEGPSA
jgi:hypothetical protein